MIIDKAFDGEHLMNEDEDQISKDFHIVIGRERQNMMRRNERKRSVFSVANKSMVVKIKNLNIISLQTNFPNMRMPMLMEMMMMMMVISQIMPVESFRKTAI